MNKIKFSQGLTIGQSAIISGDFESPEYKIAEFTDQFTEKAKRQLILNHNYGAQMIEIYEQHRENMHISNVSDMIQKMEKVHEQLSRERLYLNRYL